MRTIERSTAFRRDYRRIKAAPAPKHRRAARANREKVGTPMPIWRAEVSMAGSYSADLRGRVLAAVEAGRHARGGGAAVRDRPLDRPPLGAGGPRRGASCRQAAGRRPEAADQRRGGGGAAGGVGGGEPPDPGRVPRPARRADRGAGAPVDGGPGAAAGRERGAAYTRPSGSGRTWPPRAPRGGRTWRRAWAGSRRSAWCSWTSAAC